MPTPPLLDEIVIRTELQPGDLGYITYLHGRIYKQECDYGIGFEAYVAEGLAEFYHRYDPEKDRVWVCEHEGRMVGFLLLMHREAAVAQLRYFILLPEYRGIGLGKRLMALFMAALKQAGYRSAYLVTTRDQQTAIALYQRYGFELMEEQPFDTFGKQLYEQKYTLNSIL